MQVMNNVKTRVVTLTAEEAMLLRDMLMSVTDQMLIDAKAHSEDDVSVNVMKERMQDLVKQVALKESLIRLL
jgi:hypothetical protein